MTTNTTGLSDILRLNVGVGKPWQPSSTAAIGGLLVSLHCKIWQNQRAWLPCSKSGSGLRRRFRRIRRPLHANQVVVQPYRVLILTPDEFVHGIIDGLSARVHLLIYSNDLNRCVLRRI